MVKTVMTFIFAMLLPVMLVAEDWEKSLDANVSFTQVALDNWSAGGEDTFSGQIDLDGDFIFKKRWSTDVKVQYGLSKSGSQSLRKTSDEFRVESTYTFEDNPKFNPYTSVTLLTQLAEGKDYEAEGHPVVSGFFDPAYLTESAGFEATIKPWLKTRAGVALKQTFVNTSSITSDKSEGGAEFWANVKKQLATNIQLNSTLQLFNGFEAFDKTDIYWDSSLNSKINSWLSWQFSYNIILDKDVSEDLQRNQSAGLSLTYSFI